MKNRNSNNNKFHHRCQQLLNYNLLLQTYNSFLAANYVFRGTTGAKLVLGVVRFHLSSLRMCIGRAYLLAWTVVPRVVDRCVKHVLLRAALATPLSAHGWAIRRRAVQPPLFSIHWYCIVLYGLTSHSTHYTSFRRRFYRSDDPTNSVIALKDDSLPDQGPIPQAQHTKR